MGAMILSAAVALGAAGCHPPGKPGFRPETMRPDQTLQFNVLYKSNCSACHGDQGLNGAGLPMDNPVYLAWAGRPDEKSKRLELVEEIWQWFQSEPDTGEGGPHGRADTRWGADSPAR
jgi:hypothetical protein